MPHWTLVFAVHAGKQELELSEGGTQNVQDALCKSHQEVLLYM